MRPLLPNGAPPGAPRGFSPGFEPAFYGGPPLVFNPPMAPFGMTPPPMHHHHHHHPFYGYGPSMGPRGFPGQPRLVPTSAPPRGPTVYVGRLSPKTEDAVIRQLLSECGTVIRWTRTQDPVTKKLSAFGFAEFDSPLGVVRAARCLNGLALDGQSLVANCEDELRQGLEFWRTERHNKLREENPAKTAQEIDADIEKEDQRIEQSVKRLAADYNQKHKSPTEPAEPPPAEQPAGPQPAPAARPRNWTDAMDGYVDVSAIKLNHREAQRIHKWNQRVKESRGEFRRKEAQWERLEPSLFRERNKRRDAAKAAMEKPSLLSASQVAELIELDLGNVEWYLGQDGGVWEGPLGSRRQAERSGWILRERENDRLDVELEREEVARALAQEEAAARSAAAAAAAEAAEAAAVEAAAAAAAEAAAAADAPENPPASAEATAETPQGATALAAATAPLTLDVRTMKLKLGPRVTAQEGMVDAVFDDSEDLEAATKTLTTPMDLHLDREKREARDAAIRREQERLAKLAAQIPKTTEALFAFNIEWELLRKHEIFELKVRPWIAKKVAEFLGEEEAELTAFIITRITQGPEPQAFLEELREFLDEDAPGFVFKLWKLLAYEVLRLRQEDL